MFRILDSKQLASDVKWFKIAAPLVAKHRQPGQFVILRANEPHALSAVKKFKMLLIMIRS